MKRGSSIVYTSIALSLILIFAFLGFFLKPTGLAVSDSSSSEKGAESFGPSAEEQSCMMQCMGCSSIGVGCTGNQEQCTSQCNVVKPEQTEEEQCVETCSLKGCEQYDFVCQKKNQEACDKECGMIKEPESSSEEQACITNCVQVKSPGTICKPSQEGEVGDAVCQECASKCEYLYAGPCLNEEKLEVAKKECETCEHCYGEPVMGASGEGWDCIVDVECKDASSEFGDEPGAGEGIASRVGDVIGNAVGGVVDFFREIFTRESTEAPASEETSAEE